MGVKHYLRGHTFIFSMPDCRALGDIGNLVGPFNTRCTVGKENAAPKEAALKQARSLVTLDKCPKYDYKLLSSLLNAIRH